MIDTPILTEATAQAAAVIHLTIPRAAIQAVMHPAIEELLAAIRAAGAQPAGPLYTHHLTTSSTEFDFEVGFPVSGPIAPSGRVKMSGLPAARVVRTIYRGPYEDLFGAWSEFSEWMKRAQHKGTGQIWERYVVGPESGPDPAQWQTELNIPLTD